MAFHVFHIRVERYTFLSAVSATLVRTDKYRENTLFAFVKLS